MGFRQMIKKVQMYSGFSDKESKEALEHMVESLAVRLNDGERKDFASQLPQQLKAIALTVRSTADNTRKDLVEDFMEAQKVDMARAKKQIHSTWRALKEAISPGEINDIRAQLPNDMVAMLR